MTPSVASARSMGPIGRSRARGSPSSLTSPRASAATGGRKRIKVPASPQSMLVPPVRSDGVTSQSATSREGAGTSSIRAPSARRASTISSVSRERSGERSRDGCDASAEITR